MKNKKINFIKLGILLFGISLLLWNCQNEDLSIPTENQTFSTVEINEALSFIENKKYSSYKARESESFINSISTQNLKQENITNTEAKLTLLPVKTKFDEFYSRIALLKIKDSIKSVVININPHLNLRTEHFSGQILISDLNGNFNKAFKIYNGSIIRAYNKSKYSNKSFRSSPDGDAECRKECGHDSEDKYCICNDQLLNEIVVSSSNVNYLTIADLYDTGGGENSNSGCEVGCNSWSYGGGSSSNNNNDQNDDDNQNDDNPCDRVKKLETNSKFKEKLKELKANTSKDYESGFLINHDGKPYDLVEGNPGENHIDLNVIGPFGGFIHTHIPPLGRPIFSTNDIKAIYDFYIKGFINNSNTFLSTIIAYHETSYTIIINDITKFKSFGRDNLTDTTFTSFSHYYSRHYDLYSGPLYGYNEIKAREVAMLKALENSGLSLLKGNSDYSKWQKIETQNADIKNVNCK
ncbi:hypothetical protein BA195_13850 [Tenacibaculum soleae]|uniref:Uncharacterized protein n=1 Tax=Tenacibaculum soleae TaxID=447689 RepID=A0A1B9XYS1_9FLAO|nr:hypothetical protein [Tenacibaculum soleae]OCK42694.1 hypothetical protein BA195_13850 [Tenacibaculum soleae]